MPYGGAGAKVTTVGARAEFLQTLRSAPDSLAGWVEALSTTRKSETFVIVGTPPVLQEWADERTDQDVFETTKVLTPVHYEAMLKAHRDDMADDQLGAYLDHVRGLATRVVQHRRKLVMGDLIDAGYSATGAYGAAWDTQAFWDTDHADPGPATYTTSWDNDLTGAAATGTTPTVAEVHTALDAMEEQFKLKKDDKGYPWDIVDFATARKTIVAPPDLEQPILRAVMGDRYPVSGGPLENTARMGRYEFVCNRDTANADRFQIFLDTQAVGVMDRQQARFQQVTGSGSGEVSHEAFLRLFDYFGVDVRLIPYFKHHGASVSYIFS